jgi:hypothetical protein
VNEPAPETDAKGDTVSENGKAGTSEAAGGPERSKRLRAITCVSGMGAAAVGFVYVVTGNARAVCSSPWRA